MSSRFPDRLPGLALPLVAAWLVAVPLVLPVPAGQTVHDAARAVQLLLLAVCALAAWAPARRLRGGPVAAALLACAAVSVVGAAVPAMALREVALVAGLGALALVAAEAGPTATLRWAVVAATGLYAAAVLAVAAIAVLAGSDAALLPTELIFGYANRRHFNHVQTVALPLCLGIAAAAGDADRRLRVAATAAAAASAALLVLTFGRATLLGLAIGLAAAALAAPAAARPLWRRTWVAGAIGLGLYALVFLILPALGGARPTTGPDLSVGHVAGDQSRFALWAWALEAWRSAPWFGVGPMHLSHRFNGIVAHPHDLPLQLLAEWGLGFTLLALWTFAVLLRRLAKAARGGPMAAAVAWAVAAMAIDSLFSGNAVMPVSQVWIALALGWALHLTRAAPEPLPGSLLSPPSPPVWRSIAAAAVLALPLWLAATALREWPDLPASLQSLMRTFPSEQRHPRFWSHGWF